MIPVRKLPSSQIFYFDPPAMDSCFTENDICGIQVLDMDLLRSILCDPILLGPIRPIRPTGGDDRFNGQIISVHSL